MLGQRSIDRGQRSVDGGMGAYIALQTILQFDYRR